ncbi:MAG: sigma 54-interacting transcriptional regulator [Planctomycetes bacterium]|nr:sigma 54-interacting transcriptional regulator [Planctomycetota bacterium]
MTLPGRVATLGLAGSGERRSGEPESGKARVNERDRFEALAEICEAVGVLQDLDSLLAKTLDLVVRHLGVERAIVFLWDPEKQELRPRAVRGIEETALADAREVSRTALERALSGGGVLHIPDSGELADPSRSVMELGIRSILAAPILLRGEPVGAVYADTRASVLSLASEDLSFAAAFANQIGVAVENANLYGRLKNETATARRAYATIEREIRDRFSVRHVIGQSQAFQKVLELVDRLKTGRTTVLLLGESGTGKELIARAIHFQSDRAAKPFVALNCAALPESLLESELFGIEEGVATGVKARAGRFEDADGGTLFLDEVGDMTPPVQAKVLRVLQERTLERVGGKKTIQVDVRVIAATSRDVEEMIREGEFREDLYYRLAVFPIRLPPLRERREDIPVLARRFAARFAAEHGKGTLALADSAVDALLVHDWPGNVRELENVIERAVLLARGPVLTRDLLAGALGGATAAPRDGPRVATAPGNEPFGEELLALAYEEARNRALDLFDGAYLERALAAAGGNVTQAALATGLRRQRIHEIAKRLCMDVSRFRESGEDAT